jgi:hypothetical protein
LANGIGELVIYARPAPVWWTVATKIATTTMTITGTTNAIGHDVEAMARQQH